MKMRGLILAALAVIALLVGAYAYMMIRQARLESFDKQRWMAEAKADPKENKRSLMVRDLEKRLRKRMSEAEIIALMGQPDAKSGARFSYGLGTPFLDYDNYVIEFDAERKVARYFIDKG